VKNKDYTVQNPIELESLRSELIEKTLNTSSNNLRLFLYQNYFQRILATENVNFEEAYLKEFIDDYVFCINKFEIWGIEPEISKNILDQIKKVSSLKIASENSTPLNSEVDRIEKQIEKLNLILEGKDIEDGETHKAFFPLIDKEAPVEHPYGNGFYGIVESVTVRISKTADNDKFIIVPSEKEIEKRILEQCKLSWHVALDLSKAYVRKPFRHHEVIISFDKKDGFYEGNSLGIALTLSFLEQLLKFYNPAYIINIKEHSAFTGGVTQAGEVLCTSEEIIKQKVATVFFSEINTFVFPKCEETYAYFAFTLLKKTYPDRKLKLIPVEDINDVINRRDVVDIKKQKLIVRSGKFVKKNWLSTVATVLLAILFAFLFVMDFDDNPASLYTDGNTLYIKNKSGKILWTKHLSLKNNVFANEDYLARYSRICDVNSDGINEVLIANEQIGNTDEMNTSCYLRCYTNKQELLWQYSFNEKVTSHREALDSSYSIYMIDTLNISRKKSLYIIANNGNSFSSALFSINLKTHKKNPGILWCSGHIYDGIISDIDDDGNKDIFCLGLDNGFEDVVLFGVKTDTLNQVRPSTNEYTLNDYPTANFITYIRIPKNDIDKIYQNRFVIVGQGSLQYINNKNEYQFFINSGTSERQSGVWYALNKNLVDFNLVIDNQFRVLRDSLVARHKLNLPYTDTEDYKNIIKNNILYWQDGNWVKRNELE